LSRLAWPVLIAVILLSGCSLPPPTGNPLDDELDELTALLVGDYYSDADGGAREGRAIYLRVREVPPPAGRRHALYAEMRHDGPDGEFYRQSIYVFDESTGRALNLMTALGVADRQAAARLVDDPSGLRRGDVQTTPQLAPGCEMAWTRTAEGFAGRIDPERCQITGKRGDVRRIEAVTRISADAIGQLERGFAPDGTLLFGNADGALYRWPRVKSTGSQP
jgi:hypothetical protein